MSLEQCVPDMMPLPLREGVRLCYHGSGVEMLVGRPEGDCTCGNCPPVVPHVALVITHAVGAPYFVALPKAHALSVGRQLIARAEELPDPAGEPEVAAKKG